MFAVIYFLNSKILSLKMYLQHQAKTRKKVETAKEMLELHQQKLTIVNLFQRAAKTNTIDILM